MGQEAAESLMTPGLKVTRISRVTKPDYTTTEEETLVYEGIYKLQTYEPDAIVYSSGGRPVTTQEYRLHVPVGAGPFKIGDVARLEGHVEPFRIDGLIEKTFQTAQRLKVTVIPSVTVIPG
jgi:hypothetical protein